MVARPFTMKEVRAAIKAFNPKVPGYDLIINQVLQKLPKKV